LPAAAEQGGGVGLAARENRLRQIDVPTNPWPLSPEGFR
jgi:hypothetical protein